MMKLTKRISIRRETVERIRLPEAEIGAGKPNIFCPHCGAEITLSANAHLPLVPEINDSFLTHSGTGDLPACQNYSENNPEENKK